MKDAFFAIDMYIRAVIFVYNSKTLPVI